LGAVLKAGAVYIIQPPIGSCFRNNKVFVIFMSVPETAMYKYYGSVFWLNYIGFAGEFFIV